MASHTELAKSYSHTLLYPPLPADLAAGRSTNFSAAAYKAYQWSNVELLRGGRSVAQSFLVWHRGHRYDPIEQKVKDRDTDSRTRVVACRYWYELTDGFWGQFVLTQLPHAAYDPEMAALQLLPHERASLDRMKHFVGALEYLSRWRWRAPGQKE